MSGQQSIIDRIISEAHERAADVIDNATKEAELLIFSASKENAKLCDALLDRASNDAESIVSSRLREHDLEVCRKVTSARFSAIEEAFFKAKKRLMSLSDKEYLAYIKKQIKRYANDGDEVIISSLDKKRITVQFIAEIAKELDIKLTLSDAFGDFEFGVILKGEFWDSNLTLDTNYRFFREELESVVSKMLVEEN